MPDKRPVRNCPWTPEDDETLKRVYGSHSKKEVARLMGRTENSVKLRGSLLGITDSSEERWQPEQIVILDREYATRSMKELVKLIGRTRDSIRRKASQRGLKKTRPTESLQHYGDGIVLMTRVAGKHSFGKLTKRHRRLWEEHNGPIPKGYVVKFIDGNPMNAEIENLRCISRSQHAKELLESDTSIARVLAMTRFNRIDRTLSNELVLHPELLDLKRKQLRLRRVVREIQSQQAEATQ